MLAMLGRYLTYSFSFFFKFCFVLFFVFCFVIVLFIYITAVLFDSGVNETFCGGAWERLAGQNSAFYNLGTCTARYEC